MQRDTFRQSKDFSLLHSQNSLKLINGGGSNKGNNSQLEVETTELSTGLKMIVDEYVVNVLWQAEKQKELAFELLVAYFRREKILNNFEKMEILLLADSLVFNLIFAKEQLYLNDHKSAVFLSLMDTLFKNDNASYIVEPESKEETMQEKYESLYGGDRKSKLTQEAEENPKELGKDLAVFKEQLLNHCIDNPPEQQKIFEPYHVMKILEYVNKAYVEKFSLYKYIFANKKINEEIKLHVYIDEPLPVNPLYDAQYMGYDYQIVIAEDADETEFGNYQKAYVRKLTFCQQAGEHNSNKALNLDSISAIDEEDDDDIPKYIRETIIGRCEEFEGEANEKVELMDKEVDEALEAILDPKKKKK